MPNIDWREVRQRIESAFSDVDWGSAPAWLAAVFAALAAWETWRILRAQRTQLAEQREFIAAQSGVLEQQHAELRAAADDRRRAQARLVEVSSGLAEDPAGLPEGVAGPARVASVTNSSREPIRHVDVRFGPDGLPVQAMETFGSRRSSLPPLEILGPRRGVSFFSATLSDDVPAPATAIVRFTDHEGIHWQLDEDGRLTELADREAW